MYHLSIYHLETGSVSVAQPDLIRHVGSRILLLQPPEWVGLQLVPCVQIFNYLKTNHFQDLLFFFFFLLYWALTSGPTP
jgi:hypothetical protein